MKKTIGILIIVTGKYDMFLQPLLDSIDTHFFKNDDVIVYLFCDKEEYQLKLSSRMSVIYIPTKHLPWPGTTLFRYRYFTNAASKMKICSHIFYIDCDMMIVGDIDEEILGDITVTRHPGFWNNTEWGSPSINTRSMAYLREDERHRYVCGGFNGGATDKFLRMSEILAQNIDDDYGMSIIAQHNDESHINCFVNKTIYKEFPDWKVTELTPSYCMLPDLEARVKFGVEGLPAIIYALNKNAEELRKI